MYDGTAAAITCVRSLSQIVVAPCHQPSACTDLLIPLIFCAFLCCFFFFFGLWGLLKGFTAFLNFFFYFILLGKKMTFFFLRISLYCVAIERSEKKQHWFHTWKVWSIAFTAFLQKKALNTNVCLTWAAQGYMHDERGQSRWEACTALCV